MRLANEICAAAMEHVRGELRPGMKESEAAAIWHGFVHGEGTGWQGKVELALGFSLVWSGVGIKTFTATGDLPVQRGRADAVRDLGLRRRLLVRPHEAALPGRAARRLPRARSRAAATSTSARSTTASPGASLAELDRAGARRASRRSATRASRRIRSATASAPARTSRRTRTRPAAARSREGMVLAIEPGCYWDGGGGLRVEDNFLITERGRREALALPGRSGAVSDLTLIWTGVAERRVRDRRPRRPLRHDAARRRADGRRRARPGAEARDRAAARRARRRPDRGRLPARLRRRLARGRADRRRRPARRGLGLLARGAGRPRGARRARRPLLGDRVADLRPEARRDRRLAREDARADHERDALRRRARHPRGVLRRRLDARRARLLPAGSTRRRSRRARSEVVVVDTLGIASPEAVADLVGSTVELARRDAGALPRPQRLRARDRERRRGRARGRDAGCTGRSTAWASAPATRTSARSR